MNCKDVIELLSAYVDGEITGEEIQQVDSHLEGCPHCQSQLAAIKNLISMVHELDELEVPAGVSRSLRQIATDKPSTTMPAKGWLTNRLSYLVATGAVAIAALTLLLIQINTGDLDKQEALTALTGKAPVQELSKKQAIGSEEKSAEVTGQHDIDQSAKAAPDGTGAIPNTYGGDGYSYSRSDDSRSQLKLKRQESPAESDELLLRGLPGSTNEAGEQWPMVQFSNKNYDKTSAEVLLGDIQEKTNGAYSVKDAKENQALIISKMVKKIDALGGRGDLMRSPVNGLINQTKRSALPVYMEKAKFDKQDCWLIIIRWGFGSDENDLYKTSLYITDLSGWSVIHYISN